jgi:cell division protein FtsA
MKQTRSLFMKGIKPLPARRPMIVSVLDVGSSKITCLIARLTPFDKKEGRSGRTHGVDIIGYGLQRARGIKSGVVIDLDQAEQSIRNCVDAAERMAEMTIDSVIVNISAGRIQSETFSASIELDGHPVDEADIARVLGAASRHAVDDRRTIIHSMPIGFSMDAEHGIHDPRQMLGSELGVDIHLVTADNAPVRNLELVINRCHLDVEAMVATPFSTGLSCLVEDETSLGVVCLDMGGGTTTLSVFLEGECIFVDALAIGGQHITMDIARGLSTRLEDAERLKTMEGAAMSCARDDRDIIKVPHVYGDQADNSQMVPRSSLTRIIRPRVEEILELVRDRLKSAGFAELAAKRLVLTGGGSQLTGLSEVAHRIVSRNIRIGHPLNIDGLPARMANPAFCCVSGLLIFPQLLRIEQRKASRVSFLQTGTGGYFSRMSQWIKESF